ncbi:MAG: GxxExxY protein [Chitinophagaceae bacterium]|nr:GxxExxY protein [Chitinophagaceae bacterium]
MLEKVYEVCFCHELTKKGISFERQVDIPITYDGLVFEEGLRVDVWVDRFCEKKKKKKKEGWGATNNPPSSTSWEKLGFFKF